MSDKPDLERVMAEVEESVARKKAEGLYDPAEVRRVEEMAVALAAEDGSVAEMSLRHANLQELWDAKAFGAATHRPGLAGRLVLAAKRLLYKLAKPYSNLVLARQVSFNDELIKLLNVMVPGQGDHRFRLYQAERRVEALEDLLRDLGAELRQYGARLETQEQEASSARGQVEVLLARLQEIVERQAAAGQIDPQAARQVAAERARSRGASYLAFEDLHRGSRREIKQRQGVYLDHFRPAISEKTPLVDLGCGRGEFLELCAEAGLPARGVDINPQMVAFCQEQGLAAQEGDARGFLRDQPDGSLGGILMAQVIEHLENDELLEVVSLAAAKLAPGGVFMAETINPACLSTFAGAFYLDLSHQKPIHPEAAKFLWRWAGLGQVDIIWLSPVPPEACLEPFGEEQGGLAGAFNRNVARLNRLLYSHLDYAVKGVK